MVARERVDPGQASDGLHNLLTGLTLQSPAPSPSSLHAHATANLTSSLSAPSAPSLEQTLFNTPSRSIFSSGPPTSSLSASVAQASISAAAHVQSCRPLAALTGTTSSATSRYRGLSAGVQDPLASSRVPGFSIFQAEKDIDDTTSPMDFTFDAGSSINPAALTRFFATTSATSSREAPNNNNTNNNKGFEYVRATTESSSLPEHLYRRGFLDGRHSDITVHAFSIGYQLHRLLLDRSPFFSTALSQPWVESTAKEITLHPEDIDPNITQKAFELVLKRLYGVADPSEEFREATGLLATASWLEMTHLVDSSVESMMRQMKIETLSGTVQMVTNNYYGRAGERILRLARAMLAREGWEMPLRYWDGIPGEVIRTVIGGDGFYVPEEWDRWVLAKRLLNRRLRAKMNEAGAPKPPADLLSGSDHSDSTSNRAPWRQTDESRTRIYADADIVALCEVLEFGVHYTHMPFERLQYIQSALDVLGNRLVPPETIFKALWMSTELRQRIINAPEVAIELGLKRTVPRTGRSSGTNMNDLESTTKDPKQESPALEDDTHAETDMGADATMSFILDADGNPKRFWIPAIDTTRLVGESTDVKKLRSSANQVQARSASTNTNLLLDDGPTAPLRNALQDITLSKPSGKTPMQSPFPTREKPSHRFFSCYPPFRFSVEFPNPRSAKEKKRVYSRMVWYAGSMWNVYIQKLHGSRSVQLGVYLHRVRDREGDDHITGLPAPRSVDDAIGQLEREMLLRRRERRSRHPQHDGRPHSNNLIDAQDEAGLSSTEINTSLVSSLFTAYPSGRTATGFGALVTARKDANKSARRTPSYAQQAPQVLPTVGDDDSNDEMEELFDAQLKRVMPNVSAIPPYIDGRPTIRTYFKIYQMNPEGNSISVHKSAPDVFNFSQSWGWKSVVDEASLNEHQQVASASGSMKEDRIRFCIVLGNV